MQDESNPQPYEILPNGRAHSLIPTKNLTKQKRSTYRSINRRWYKHHAGAKRLRNNPLIVQNDTVENDPAVQRYYIAIRNKPRNDGYLSKNSRVYVRNGVRQFLTFLNIPITETALSELIAKKRANPQDYTLDDALERYANPDDKRILRTRRNEAAYLLGLFKANRCKLQATSNTHIPSPPTKPISEGILKELYQHLDQRNRDMMSLQAYSGQRVKALCTIPLDQIDTTSNKDYAILTITSNQNKSRVLHQTLIPIQLANSILQRCKELHLKTPFPNYEQLWKAITHFAKEYYGIRLTSHYLRKRFSTTASETPMDVNQWDYLMGTKKSKGHDANVYNLTFIDRLIKSYHTYLVNTLSLDNASLNDETTQTKGSNDTDHSTLINELQQIIEQQSKQIQILTNLLKAKTNV